MEKSNLKSMFVIKRNHTSEEVSFDKIYRRIRFLTNEPFPLKNVNIHMIAQNVIQELYDGVSTIEIDTHSAIICANLCIKHYEYGILAGRIAINNHQKNTLTSFKDKMDQLYLRKDGSGQACPIIHTIFYKFVKKHQKRLEAYIDYSRDYLLDFFAFKTLERSYLLKIQNSIIERPQDLFMRVAIGIHMSSKSNDVLDLIFETYDLLSLKYFTHATPTLFNAGLVRPALASCFLLGTDDSIEGIFKTVTDSAYISKWSGGIGIHISNWRGADSLIRGTGGNSSGIIPFLKILNETSRAVNQGGRRPGSFAVYLEPHHPDIMDFLNLRRPNIPEEFQAKNLFIALTLTDLFMQRVKEDKMWSLFCPDQCSDLFELYGPEYEKRYNEYEAAGVAVKSIRAREIWKAVFNSQKESGLPYILYKDAVNRNNNQSNLGTIKSSNLCMEIVEYSSSSEYAVCTLSSICLPQFVEDSYSEEEEALPDEARRALDHEFPVRPVFNYEKFEKVVAVVVRNLNKVIDYTYYPVPETKRSNLRHRPMGIGVQGLADVFFKFNIAFDSPEAKQLNRYIFETLYYTAYSTSTTICREIYKKYKLSVDDKRRIIVTEWDGKKTEYTPETLPPTIGAYPSYLENGGSPMSRGIFHWEMMGLKREDLKTSFDWDSLRDHIAQFGIRNSLMIALMPTASTSQIMGNIEAFEPLTSNIFTRNTLAGEFIVVNKYLLHDLQQMGLWTETMENWIKLNDGSIQSIEGIPDSLKQKYKTVWELSQKVVIDLAADRQPFIDQSQSLNLFVEDLTFAKFNSMHFYGWSKGLKTGCYYLRSKAATQPEKFTIEGAPVVSTVTRSTIIGPTEDCLVCGS
jgi:ribonucleoside-diphosphate reductase alpha chain